MKAKVVGAVVAVVLAGWMAGTARAQLEGLDHAFVWSAQAGIADLGVGQAFGINSFGVAVGITWSWSDPWYVGSACRWDPTTGKSLLSTLPDSDSMFEQYTAMDVNDSGQVVGYRRGWDDRAFLWDNVSGMRDISPLPGWDSSYAYAINSSGQIVGTSGGNTATGYQSRPTLWDPVAGVIDIDPGIHGQWDAMDINDAGQIVGYGSQQGEGNVGFIWDPVEGTTFLPFYATCINNKGQVAGHYLGGCVWDADHGIRYLDSPPGGGVHVSDINDLGQVVGSSYAIIGGDIKAHALMWDADGEMHVLPDLGADYSSAYAINTSGQVAGFLIPEPATLSLLALLALSLPKRGGLALLRSPRRPTTGKL